MFFDSVRKTERQKDRVVWLVVHLCDDYCWRGWAVFASDFRGMSRLKTALGSIPRIRSRLDVTNPLPKVNATYGYHAKGVSKTEVQVQASCMACPCARVFMSVCTRRILSPSYIHTYVSVCVCGGGTTGSTTGSLLAQSRSPVRALPCASLLAFALPVCLLLLHSAINAGVQCEVANAVGWLVGSCSVSSAVRPRARAVALVSATRARSLVVVDSGER